MKANKTPLTEIDAQVIEGWKKEHGEVHEISVVDKNGNVLKGYIKEPNRHVISMAMSLYSSKKMLEAGETILDSCWLGGDERLRTEEKPRIAAAMQAQNAVEMLESSMVKL